VYSSPGDSRMASVKSSMAGRNSSLNMWADARPTKCAAAVGLSRIASLKSEMALAYIALAWPRSREALSM
jgi:hypothetical protein